LIYIKYEHEAQLGPCDELYDAEVDAETTLKEVKNKSNETFIFGEVEPNQYLIYKGGEQEAKGKNKKREPMKYQSEYNEPTLLDDDIETLQDDEIYIYIIMSYYI